MMRCRFFVATILLAVSACCAADLPAPAKTDFTMHDFRRLSLEHDKRLLSGSYLQVGQRDPAWDDDAVRALDALAIRFNNSRVGVQYQSADDTSDAVMTRLAYAGQLARCKDPMILYTRAIIYRDSKSNASYEAILKQLTPPLLESKYPAQLKFFALQKYLQIHDPQRTSVQENQLTERLYHLFADYLIQPVAKPVERRFKAKNLLDDYFEFKAGPRQVVLKRLEEAPLTDPWILHMTRGIHEYQLAWEARGGDFADTVTQDGWKGFAEHLAKARQSFEAAYRLEPTYPESAKMMIQVAMGLSADDCKTRDWFDRAIAAQIDYMPAWHAYEFSIYPRWHGSHKEMYALGQEALRTGRFDTAVPMFLIDVVYDIKKDRYPDSEGYDLTSGSWNDIKAMYEGYLKNPAPKLDVKYWRSRQLGYAYHCQAYDDCLAILDELENNVDLNALYNFAPTPQEIRAEAAAMVSDQSAALRRARRLELATKSAQASRAYQRIVEAINPQHVAWNFAQQHAYYCDAQAKLSSGVKLDLPMKKPDPLYFWRDTEKASWQQNDDCLEFSPKGMAFWAMLRAGCPVPENIRVKVEWSYSAPADRAPAWYLYLSEMSQTEGGYFGVQALPREKKIQLGCAHWRLEESIVRDPDLRPDVWHTWVLERRKDVISLEHDGKTIIDKFRNAWNDHGSPVLVFYAYPNSSDYSIRLRNVSVEALGAE